MLYPVSAGISRALARSAGDTTVPAPTIVTASAGIERCHRGIPFARDRGHVDPAAHLVREPAQQSGQRSSAGPTQAPRPRRGSSRPGPPRGRRARQWEDPRASPTAAPRQTDRLESTTTSRPGPPAVGVDVGAIEGRPNRARINRQPHAGPEQPAQASSERECRATARRTNGRDRREARHLERAEIRRDEGRREARDARKRLDGERAGRRRSARRTPAESPTLRAPSIGTTRQSCRGAPAGASGCRERDRASAVRPPPGSARPCPHASDVPSAWSMRRRSDWTVRAPPEHHHDRQRP